MYTDVQALSGHTCSQSVSWQPGTFLNGLDHIQLPNDHQFVPLRGTVGNFDFTVMVF